MHEFSVVEQLIERVLEQVKAQKIDKIKSIRLQRNSTFSKEALIQAYEILTQNNPLQDSELIVEDFSVEKTCESCGHTQIIRDEDLLGHLYVCPQCGAACEIEEAHGLKVLEVVV